MQQHIPINATVRSKLGKREAARLRMAGWIPAELYGKGVKNMSLVLDKKEFNKALSGEAGLNVLMDLQVEGKGRGKTLVMMKQYQADSVSRDIIHVDLYKVDLKEEITVMVKLTFEGKPVGVEKGGILEQVRRDLEVSCLPDKIPDTIVINVSRLEIGQSIHVEDLKLPEGVKSTHEQNFTIVAVLAPRAEEEKPPAEEAAPVGEAAAEGEKKPEGEGKKAEEKPAAEGKEEAKEKKAKKEEK